MKRKINFIFNRFASARYSVKLIFLFMVLISNMKGVVSQTTITVRDTVYFDENTYEVYEQEVELNNHYHENILFYLLDTLENDENVSPGMISNFCEIPVDNGCHGCDFEDTSEVNTQYWAASVDYFDEVNEDDTIINRNIDISRCPNSFPVNPVEQCKCTSAAISTPAFYCNTNTEKFTDFTFYDGCDLSKSIANSRIYNHFKLVQYDDLYNSLGLSVPTGLDSIKRHFGDSLRVMRLGDIYGARKIASLIKRIVVDTNNLNFTFDFAMKTLDPNHSELAKPTVSVKIYDNNRENVTLDEHDSSRVDLGWNNFEIISNHPNLNNITFAGDDWAYLDWSCGKIDLSDFNIGDTMYVVFEQRDCGHGSHWSSLYIDNIGNGLCSKTEGSSSINYKSDLSYTCGDTVALTFSYEIPTLNLDTHSVSGELQIEIKLFENSTQASDSISSGIINLSNGASGLFTFKIPKSQFNNNYVDATFTYSSTSSVSHYNLIPYFHQQHISLPTADICSPTCASFSELDTNTNVHNTYLLDDNFLIQTVDGSGVIFNLKQGDNIDDGLHTDGFKAYTGPGRLKNACMNDLDKLRSAGSAISDSLKKNHLQFIFKEPVESFSLKLIDYGGIKYEDATIYKVFLKAFDIEGELLDIDSLTIANGGDFCSTAPTSKYTTTKNASNYNLYNSGLNIKKVELSFYNNSVEYAYYNDSPVDPNTAIGDMCYVPCFRPEIVMDEFTCSGDTIYLTDIKFRPDKSYTWTGPGGFTANTANINIPNANSFHNGTYILKSYSPNCGNLYDTVHIDMTNNYIRRLGKDTVLCDGQSLILNATSASATYLWSTGENTSTISVDTSAEYWVAITRDTCTKYDTIKVAFIDDPALQSIPYKTRHNCIDDDSGILQLLWDQKIGGELSEGTEPKALTYINNLDYELFIDDKRNGTFDALCSSFFKKSSLSAYEKDSLFITGLPLGDYKIILKPNTICRKIIVEDTITIDSTCMDYHQCYNDSIEFTFTIKEHIYPPPLGDDVILCPGGSVSIQVPSTYYDNLPPEYIKWGSICGIYDTEYDISELRSGSAVTDTIRDTLTNGRGGVHIVEISTQDGCIIRDTIIVADLKPLIIPDSMPSAIATNAVNFGSFWSTQYNTIKWEEKDMVESFKHANIFYKGVGGIWRPKKNHDYLDTLNSTIGFINSYGYSNPSEQLGDMNIRTTGNIMPYILFNYGNPLFSDCVPQWVHNSTMTKYSPSGYDTENRDIMGIFSSALYGYNDMLPIAVSSNAKNDEIGFESFEEYSNDINAVNCFDSITQLNNSTGNIDLVKQTESLMMPKSVDYEIVRAFNRYAMIKGNICKACDDPIEVKVNAQTVPVDIREPVEEEIFTSVKTKILASPCGDSTYTILQLDKGLTCENIPELKCRFWVGSLVVEEKRFVPLIEGLGFELDDTRSHSGTYSLRVPKEELIFLPQVELTLQPKKTYHIGAWIHSASMSSFPPEILKYKHEQDSIGIFVKLPNNEKIFIKPSGEVIDGWQRVEGTFTMPSGTRTQIELGFHSLEEFNIDDIRIYPQNSALQTYIYDPSNYKVRAVLDQNNYATMYQYDEEGNLFSIKKETVKGIKTIQVSGSHLKSERP